MTVKREGGMDKGLQDLYSPECFSVCLPVVFDWKLWAGSRSWRVPGPRAVEWWQQRWVRLWQVGCCPSSSACVASPLLLKGEIGDHSSKSDFLSLRRAKEGLIAPWLAVCSLPQSPKLPLSAGAVSSALLQLLCLASHSSSLLQSFEL